MDKYKKKKNEQLGIDAGTASSRLKKIVMYNLAKKLDENYCFQCGLEIESYDEFTIEHKVPWLDSETPKELFFSIDNIAFSHYKCNIAAARKVNKGQDTSLHGTISKYVKGCRCNLCKESMKLWKSKRRNLIKKPNYES